jgi:hypothetical protein
MSLVVMSGPLNLPVEARTCARLSRDSKKASTANLSKFPLFFQRVLFLQQIVLDPRGAEDEQTQGGLLLIGAVQPYAPRAAEQLSRGSVGVTLNFLSRG